jgi:hypothetical protein
MGNAISVLALVVAAGSLIVSYIWWQRSARPIITAAVKTHSGSNVEIHYNLAVMNSGTIPAKNIRIRADEAALSASFGQDASLENKDRWLTCFKETIDFLHNSDRVSCSFGTTRANDAGFWKYKAVIPVVITYEGWFGSSYEERQNIRIRDSDSFTDGHWAPAPKSGT